MAQFGERYTPNQHNLARNFVTLDNFYCTAEVSNDGWLWTTAARAPDVVERQFAVTYAGRGLSLDSEGLSGGIEFPWAVARMVLEHHEKMMGIGKALDEISKNRGVLYL